MTQQIVLASGNKGKLSELQSMLGNLNLDIKPQSDFNVSNAAETGLTFIENAIIKARHASSITGLPSIADDSGIEVDELFGQPGIYSARFSGENATDEENNKKLIQCLAGLPLEKRTARYQCVLVYMRHAKDPMPIITHGSWEGFIAEDAKGSNGFGYDPYFYVPTHKCHAAELDKQEKNAISHRAKALKELVTILSKN